MTATSTFKNPTTGTTYRLVMVAGGGWRMTKSREDSGRTRLTHLRGQTGTEAVDSEAVANLVAGKGGVTNRRADPAATFAAVVLHDLECTSEVLTAVARRATEVYEVGCRGFRPRSSILRRQRDVAMLEAVSACQRMAAAWKTSGLEAKALPKWLVAALEDGKGVTA